MKLVTYRPAGAKPQLGVIVGDKIVNLALASHGQLPNDMRTFLEMGQMALDMAADIVAQGPGEHGVALSAVTLMAPVNNPSKVVAIGQNYLDHVREQGVEVPKIAVMFAKYPSSIIGPGDAIRWNPAVTSKVDWEVELAIVIGQRASRVSEADAYDYIAGYTNCNDVSARDLQLEKGDQWIMGKSLDTFCPLGPWLVTKDEVVDPHNLPLKCTVNGETMQDSNTRQLIYKIPYLISYLSRGVTLLPGDVVITGTPPGVGAFRNPPVFLKDGDVVTVAVEGLGQLTNPCVEEPAG